MPFTISRSIEVDVGHRVPTHGSKCANLHGHRYKVIAECSSLTLRPDTEQKDMVLDFGFLKDVLINHVDKLCDHGLVLWCDDFKYTDKFTTDAYTLNDYDKVASKAIPYYFQEGNRGEPTKLLIVPFIPTAERLAEFWYRQMKQPIVETSRGQAHLNKVIVWETPNCSATFPI